MALWQFAPIRIYHGAMSNKKCKEITNFVKENVSRKFYFTDSGRDVIVEKVKKECERLDETYVTPGNNLKCNHTTNTNGDWSLDIYYTRSGIPIEVLHVLCFKANGEIIL